MALPVPPTVMTAGAFPGELIVLKEGLECDPLRPLFPAATTTTLPKSVTALWAAAASGSQALEAERCEQSRPDASHVQNERFPRLRLRMSMSSFTASSIAAMMTWSFV